MRKSLFKQLNYLSLPLILNNLLGMVINLVMTSIIGRLSSEAIAATEVVDGLIYAIIGILGVGSLSFNIYASRIRESQPRLFQDYFKSIIELNLLIGGAGSIVLSMLMAPLLKHVYGFSGTVLFVGTSYGQILALQVLLTVLIFAFTNQLKVKKKTPLIATTGAISSLIQIGLAYGLSIHVFSPTHSLIGVAMAALVATMSECLVYCVILRKELFALLGIKSQQKIFLLKKSLPLFIQELVEGVLFSLFFTVFLSRLELVVFASYSLCRVIVNVAQIVLFPYANSLLILSGEAYGKQALRSLKQLPLLALGMISLVYLSISLLVITQPSLMSLLSNQDVIVALANEFLPGVLLVFASQILFEVSKYSLQVIGEEVKVLKATCVVNLFSVSCLSLASSIGNSLLVSLALLAINYLVLSFFFFYGYARKLTLISTGN